MTTPMPDHVAASTPSTPSTWLPALVLDQVHERLSMRQLELEERMRAAIAQLQRLREGSDLVDPDVQAPLMSALRSLDESEREAIAVADALARLRAGRYGACVRCGAAIPAERLVQRPTERLCTPCAR